MPTEERDPHTVAILPDFNLQSIAEKDQTGAWTDYVYSNGKKIARVANAVPMMHFYGSNQQTNVECAASVEVGLNYAIQTGDKLSWQEYKNNAIGGLMQ